MQQEFFFSLIQKLESQGMLENPVKLYDIANTATQSVTVDPGLGSISRLLSLAATLRRAGRQPGRRRAVTGMPDTRPSSKAGGARLNCEVLRLLQVTWLVRVMLSLRYGGATMLCLVRELASVSDSRYLVVQRQRSHGHAL